MTGIRSTKLYPSIGPTVRGAIAAGLGPGVDALGMTAVDGPGSSTAGASIGATTVAESDRATNSGARLTSKSAKPASIDIAPAVNRKARAMRWRGPAATRGRPGVAARKSELKSAPATPPGERAADHRGEAKHEQEQRQDRGRAAVASAGQHAAGRARTWAGQRARGGRRRWSW